MSSCIVSRASRKRDTRDMLHASLVKSMILKKSSYTSFTKSYL